MASLRSDSEDSEGSKLSQEQPRKMTFMEQVNKRKGNVHIWYYAIKSYYNIC